MAARYPNAASWSALCAGRTVPVSERDSALLSVVDCGELRLPSGQLVACDPFSGLKHSDNAFLQVPPGDYRVVVTLADLSEARDGGHLREAYATLLLDAEAEEVSRRIVTPVLDGGPVAPEIGDDDLYTGFFVDAGTACFVDGQAVERCMPDADSWYEAVFDSGAPDAWFERMDDPDHVHSGLANLPLPTASEGENIILIHSGWGDGCYPVVGGYDAEGRLVRAHIDFMVVYDPGPSNGSAQS